MIRLLILAIAWVVTVRGVAAQTPDPMAARSKGQASAAITIYEMSDFQCPYCRAFTLETMPLLEREFIATGKVRLVYINLPLASVHKNATLAAEVAMCAAAQRRFWPMHDLLFRNQPHWAELSAARPYLLLLADSAGLNRAALTRCLASPATAALVQEDGELARRSGARSTPTFYIEGGLLEGAAPITAFRAVLDSIYQSKTRVRAQ
ncbi:MAG TPA: thioredoxin domain-containing protein [Gemmatimonadales bacterium]|nr:thioredoxin domain-containing protein [Gemmatimonadales bacterium]